VELRAANAFASVTLAALLAACGGRSIVTLDDESSSGGGGRAPGAPGAPGARERPPLERVQDPVSLFRTEAPYEWARVVTRGDGFDLLAGRNSQPRVTVARRAVLTSEPPRLALGDADVVVASTENAWNGRAAGDRLLLCHVRYVGDPVLFTAHTGAYTPVVPDRQLFNNGFCNGFAFLGESGLVAVTRGRPIRPTLSTIGIDGYLGTIEQPAFPGAESTIQQISVTAHAGRFAWAGFIDEASVVRVGFGSGPVLEQSVDIPGEMYPDGRPRIEPWPFTDGVSVSWQETDVRSRVVAVDSDGTRHLDLVIEHPGANNVNRPEIAPTPHGLVVAYSVTVDEETEVVVELFGADGQRRATPEVLAVSNALVSSAAALGDVVLVVWSGPERAEDVAGRSHVAGYRGALFRTAP
jgi:hypothetical protein